MFASKTTCTLLYCNILPNTGNSLHVYQAGHPVGDLLDDIPHGNDPGTEELNMTLHIIFQLLLDNIQI